MNTIIKDITALPSDLSAVASAKAEASAKEGINGRFPGASRTNSDHHPRPLPLRNSDSLFVIQDPPAPRFDPSSFADPLPSEASANAPSSASPLPVPKRRRNGVIARLPKPERDMASRMIQSGVEYKMIVEALYDHGYCVTERNVSNWATRGGYADWLLQQELALNHRLVQDNLIDHLRREDASDLSEVGLQAAAASLSQLLLKHSTSGHLEADPAAFTPVINLLCRLSTQLLSLQKYREDFQHRHNLFGRAKRQAAKEIADTESSYSNPAVESPEQEPPEPSHPEPELRCQTYMQYLHRKNDPTARRLIAAQAARAAAAPPPRSAGNNLPNYQNVGVSASPASAPQSPTVTHGNHLPQPHAYDNAPALITPTT